MKRTFKNFDEYSEYYENREYKMNDVDVVENTVTVCADGEFECKNWKTAVRRFFKEINDNSLFDGWKECITECVENGIWKEKEEYNGEHVCGGWFWEVECIDEGLWYVSLTVSKEIEEESESAETVESVEETTVSETETVEETAEQTAEPETFSYEFNEIHKITISKRNNVYVEEFFEKMGGSYVKLGEEAWGCIEDIEEYYGIKINRNVQTDTEESESESEPTAENITVSGTNQDNINVLIVADIANTFEMITHTGYFDTS